ncbi:MAG TPA: glycine-rich protein [Vicinamibacterales bacterium]
MAKRSTLVLIVAALAVTAAACSKDSPTSPSNDAQLTISPNTGGQGSAVPITITGTDFVVGSFLEGSVSGPGIAVSRITALSSTSANATISIAADAALGARTLTVKTPSGRTFTGTFTVTVPAPGLFGIGPSAAVTGTSGVFTLSGSAFGTNTTVSVSGSGVTISDVSVQDSGTLTARFTVDANADIGERFITVTTPTGSASHVFTLIPPAPVLASIAPASGAPGTTVNVTLTGSNFVPGGTTVNVSGSGVTTQIVSGPQVTASGRSMVVAFVIDSNAAQGSRSVTVTTAGGTSNAQTFAVGITTLPTIGSFTATPGTIGNGGTSTLRWSGVTNATSCSINNGVGDVTCADGSVNVSPTSTTEYQFMAIGPGGREWMYALVVFDGGSLTFNFTGAAQTFTVPAGVTQVNITAYGAQGGAGAGAGPAGGLGGSVTARITVTPGEVLQVNVGGAGAAGAGGGAGGFNGGGAAGAGAVQGGGGGGASDVRQGGVALANRVVVAAGGGGSGPVGTGGTGGAGGGLNGSNGTAGTAGAAADDGDGGGGGTQAAGGAGGTGSLGADGAAGVSGVGGAGGANASATGGGGGGGLFGGGGGEGANAGAGTGGGGGGGSSFALAGASNVTHAAGVRTGNGQIVITW